MLLLSARRNLAGVAVSLLALAGLACRRDGRGTAPEGAALPRPVATSSASLLLVTIDTWRWDYVGASGARRVETPNLDRLARGGVYEPETVTSCPLTTPAHASIMTGMDPTRHRVWDCALYTLPVNIPTLAEEFRAAGFTTAAFVASETLNRRYGLHRGFESYDDVPFRAGENEGGWVGSRDGSEVTGAFQSFLRSRAPDAKLFAWVHYYDAHRPYRPRPGLDGRYPEDPYAAEVAFIDGEIGKLLSSLEGGGRKWRVVIVGDHGEGLGDRGELSHGIGLYRSTLHVPLIVHPKPEKPLLHSKPWGLVDIKATLLDWYGLPSGRREDGESLFSEGEKDRALYSVSIVPTLVFAADPSIAVRRGAGFYLRHSAEELYDLEADPGEQRDLLARPASVEVLKELRDLADRKWPKGWLAATLPSVARPSSEEERKLRSLGYVAGGSPVVAKTQSAAIGQLMRDFSRWEEAREATLASGKDAPLLDLLPRLVGRYPSAFTLRKDFGAALGKAGRTREAIEQLEAAARLFDGDSVVFGNLGSLYLAEGKVEKARVGLERSVAIDPSGPGPQKNLGIIYADYLKQPDKAVPHFQKYLDAGGDAEAAQIRAYVESVRTTGKPPSPPETKSP
jgi:arylsulfatase A-like enzyme